MKMKLAVCTTDESYASRFINYFNIHYADRMELSQFSETGILNEILKKEHFDICLIGEELYTGDVQDLLGKSMCMILVNEVDSELEGSIIYKYQKAELIYKEILRVYADKKGNFRAFREHDPNMAKVVLFCSPSGGSGATSIALAYAMQQAKSASVIYINLQQFSNQGIVLKGEGTGTFDDVIFALKSKRGSLSLKLESLVQRSKENVNFFASAINPMDLQEISGEEIQKLLTELVSCGLYQEVVIDIDNSLREMELAAMDVADSIILVEGAAQTNGMKLQQFIRALESVEEKEGKGYLARTALFYNRYSNKTGQDIAEGKIPLAGGAPRFEGVQMEALVNRMVTTVSFGKITGETK